MQGIYLRRYGVETTVDFTLFEGDGVNFRTDAVHSSGDTRIMKDEGNEADTANAFTEEGTGYSIVLTAAEMTAKKIVVYIVDQGTKAWLDTCIVIETYGDADAMHPVDLARLEKATKLLVNKAIQNKATGEIEYFGDDGETVVLTHTPTDEESTLTRTSS